jgi:hypothetical protein
VKGLHVVLDAADHSTAGNFAGPVSSHTVCHDIEAHLIVFIEGVLVVVSPPAYVGESRRMYFHRIPTL